LIIDNLVIEVLSKKGELSLMRRTAIIVIVFLLSGFYLFAEPVDVDHFLITPSLSGISGYISNPSAYTLPNANLSFGIHSVYDDDKEAQQFLCKGNYGYKDFLEGGLGINLDTSSTLAEVLKTISINFKGTILKEDVYFVTVAAGLRNFPLYLVDGKYWDKFAVYTAASKKIEDMNFSVGAKKDTKGGYIGFMADACKVINDTVLVIAEFDENHFNAGLKVSLNYNLNVEFYVKNISGISRAGEIGNFLREYFVFGITYLQ
jgi:hypothetical protein